MEKTVNKTELPYRATLLAAAAFFQQRFVFEKIIFAEIAAGEGVVHGVAVHLENQNLYCSCPFRPKPCIHALALRALFEREGEAIFSPAGELPEWVSDLQKGLPARATSHAFALEKATAGKQQRRFERLERAAGGFDDLEAWLLDTARRGLATVVSEDPRWFEGIAARMADASMTGLSRTLRLLGQIPATGPDWAAQTAAVFADCYLAVRAFRKRDVLPEALLYDLQNFIGISMKKEEVLASGEQVPDVWAVVGQMEAPLEDKLTVRRSWLMGGKTNRYALLLDFSFGSAGFPPGFEPGSLRQGTLAFYPSAFPQRALAVGDFVSVPKEIEKMPGYLDFDTFAQNWATALAAQPWLQMLPAVLSEVRPQVQGNSFFLVDKNEKSLRLDVSENTGWRLVALSGGVLISLFGEWDGAVFKPLSAVAEGRFVRI
jgi:hypothetical protein